MKKAVLFIAMFIVSCARAPSVSNVVWPISPEKEVVLLIIASERAYVAPSEHYQIWIRHGEPKSLFFGRCIYFYINDTNTEMYLKFRGMSDDFPTTSLTLSHLKPGRTYFYERDLIASRDASKEIFIESTKEAVTEACNRLGF
ncbi:hypothetical protein [Pseudoalteromonas sp. R3]|uniref:hypothetical protein n=1 Tax=Pseudoalteromonas sp. R3 TaxID=1709477 RepID=UPI0006B4ABB4|nr:hypothetical protein [Pseudoalteromonas sp. R3]AZZ97247.1 hypothetical protein ELR70_08885 [Pseudoalteromonas sp. R3]